MTFPAVVVQAVAEAEIYLRGMSHGWNESFDKLEVQVAAAGEAR